MYSRSFVGIALTFVIAVPLAAQSTHGPSLDVTIGASNGWGGKYFSRGGVAGEITLVPDHETWRIAALTVGGRGSPAAGDICAIDPGAAPGGPRCLPRFPSIVHVGGLGGLERTLPGGAVRAMAGPGFYTGGGAHALGGQLQLDAAVGFTHLAFVGAARGSVLARFRGETLRLGSLTFGLRIQ
jgi:hypothetical protein